MGCGSHIDGAIWTIKMASGARWQLPAADNAASRRNLYFFKGNSVTVDGQLISDHSALELRASQTIELINGDEASEFLFLQGRPINETVVQHGPFVMNSQQKSRCVSDYSRTRFGGWPWPDTAPVHGQEHRRFATQADGQTLTKPVAVVD